MDIPAETPRFRGDTETALGLARAFSCETAGVFATVYPVKRVSSEFI